MKNIILQHFDGELRNLDKLSIDNIKSYANELGVEYELIRGRPFRENLTPACQKVFCLDEKYDDYDYVLMLDIDMFIRKGLKENVFDEEGIGIHASVQKKLHERIAKIHPKYASINAPYWGGAIYKFDKETRINLREKLKGSETWINNYNKMYVYEDEGIMHTLATLSGMTVNNKSYLERKWCYCSYLPDTQTASFIHIRTKIAENSPLKKEKIENYRELVSRGMI